MLADTPTSIKHGADMADLVQSMEPSNDRVTASLTAGRSGHAGKRI